MDVVAWRVEFDQWQAGRVQHDFHRCPVDDGELGYVGDDASVWAITHIQGGTVTPLVVGETESVWARRPRRWSGRGHVPVPAVVLGGERRTFEPIWGRMLLGVARCRHGGVVLLGRIGEDIGMALLAPEPVLVFVGRPGEIGTVNLDHVADLLGQLHRLPPRHAAASTSRTVAATTATTSPAARRADPATVDFARVRAAVAGASLPRTYPKAVLAEIPEVLDALERWVVEGRGILVGARRTIYTALAAASPNSRFSPAGLRATLSALAQVGMIDAATRESRCWEIDPARLGRSVAPLQSLSPVESTASRPAIVADDDDLDARLPDRTPDDRVVRVAGCDVAPDVGHAHDHRSTGSPRGGSPLETTPTILPEEIAFLLELFPRRGRLG